MEYCPESNPVLYAALWYEFPEAPHFTICLKCYNDHIRPTQFAVYFVGEVRQPNPDRHCLFNTPRMLQLWPVGVRENNWAFMKEYITRRAQIPNCQKQKTIEGDGGTSLILSQEIPGLAVCGACYEDVVRASSFEGHFQFFNDVPSDHRWSCDMWIPFMQRAIQETSKTGAWKEFMVSCQIRQGLAVCAGTESVEAKSRIWYTPRTSIPGLVICGACYYDNAAATPMAGGFVQFQVPPSRASELWSCDMALLPMKVAWAQASLTKNFNVWWEAAKMIMESAPCSNNGIKDGQWYTLAQGCENFDVCARCYAGWFYALGHGSSFMQKYTAPGTTLICDFNPAAPRFQTYIARLSEAEDKKSWPIFMDYVVKFAAMPVCPRSTMVQNRRWYGAPDCFICESCFEEFARETCLASELPFQNIEISERCICCLYSPRMRKLWSEACDKRDLPGFIELAKQRLQVYAATMPRIEMILAMMRMRATQRATLFASSTMLQGGDNIVGAASGPTPYSYGNSTVGYGFATASGVQGAMQFNQALAMNPVPGNEYVEVMQLEAAWKEVE
ncbi:hypothetical protein F5884DRAFT_897786 [Xylogone sp. PMI_703]|nr:hypothetical protein F5884DRAFT_897786 [Xylogone sp. PMI_703]